LVLGLPGQEYFRNESTNRFWRIRAAARDLGAFESTSADSPVGPYDPPPRPQLSISQSGGNAVVFWPLFAQDFEVYTTDLGAPLRWNLVSLLSLTNLTGLSISTPASGRPALFRLQR